MKVTLSSRAMEHCAELGIPASAIEHARVAEPASHPKPAWLIVEGELPDGRTVRLWCRHDIPGYIDWFSLRES